MVILDLFDTQILVSLKKKIYEFVKKNQNFKCRHIKKKQNRKILIV